MRRKRFMPDLVGDDAARTVLMVLLSVSEPLINFTGLGEHAARSLRSASQKRIPAVAYAIDEHVHNHDAAWRPGHWSLAVQRL
jgi:hypothetical protein